MTHTDIKKNDWLRDKLPKRFHPYWLLMRLDRPIGTWLLLLPGWWAIILASGGALSMNAHDWWLMSLFGIGAVIMRGAGCIINDLWDRKLDQKVERTKSRPLAAGQITIKQALIFLAILLFLGLVILFQTSLVTILLGFLAIPMIVVYPLMKRLTWWPQLFLGLTFNLGALMGWAAVTGIVGLPALLMYIGGIFWTLGYDTIYAHQDKDDDALIGIKSTALKFGDNSRNWITVFYGAAFVFMGGAFIAAQAGPLSLLCLIGAAAHLFWQMKQWNEDIPESSLMVFKSNRDFGLIILLAALL